MKVGIIGSGDVAKALAGGLSSMGTKSTVGTRAPAKLAEWGTAESKGFSGQLCRRGGIWRVDHAGRQGQMPLRMRCSWPAQTILSARQ